MPGPEDQPAGGERPGIKVTSDMIRPFTGEGDVVAWIQKVKLVARLGKVTDLASFMPLYLEGSALAVYLEMSEKHQQDAQQIENRLKEVYTDGPFLAYAKLAGTKWTGEAVDVYANEIRRLVGLAGFKSDGLERMVKLVFVHGFPESIGVELQQLSGIDTMAMSDLISKARIFTTTRSLGVPSGVGAVAKAVKQPGTVRDNRNRGTVERSVFRGKCFRCDGPHMARECPDKKTISCYVCGEDGHMSYTCPNKGKPSRNK